MKKPKKDSAAAIVRDLAKQVADTDNFAGLCKVEDPWAVRELIRRARALRRASKAKGRK